MVPLLAQKAGLDDKVEVFVLYVDPITITDMIDRSLKADAHKKHLHVDAQDGNQTAVVSNRKL
jgi:hypothetical protein